MMRSQIAAACLCVGLAGAVCADGRVQGRVERSDAEVYVSGAVVRLPDLGIEAATRSDGRFVFPSVPVGEHRLAVSYLGFATSEQMVWVLDNETTNASVRLAQLMEEVVVYGQASSTASALNQQRASDRISAVVSSDQFGQLPDANVAEALQRVPGVFLERDQGEGRFVGVRGIDPNLNVTSINGIAVPAPESDTRAVALDVIPSDLLETIEVTKSFTPDMDPDGLGGSIDVRSLSGFDRKGRFVKIKTEGSYNELEEDWSPKAAMTFSDVFGQEEQFALAAAVSWFDRDFGSDNIETDGGWPVDLETVDDDEFRGAEEIEQRDFVINRERLGAALNFDWRPTDHTDLYVRALYSEFSDQEYRTRKEYKLDKGDAVSGTATSATWTDARLQREIKDRYEEQEILSVALGGTQWIEQWTIDFNYGYSESSELEPGRIDAEFEIRGVELGYTSAGRTPDLFEDAATLNPANYDLSEIVIEDNETEDESHTFAFDVTRAIDFDRATGYVKFGGKLRRREKRNDANIRVFDGFPDDPTLAVFTDSAPAYEEGSFGPGVSASRIRAFIDESIGSFELNDDDTLAGSLGGDYDIEENVDAAYIMSRMDFDSLRVVYGVRYERTEFDARGQRILFDDVVGSGDPVPVRTSFSKDYSQLLPSINVRFAPADGLVLRAAYYETIARPSFGQLSPGGEIELEEDDGENELQAKIGNPELNPLEAQNFDLSAEYYQDGIGLISAGLFLKRIDNFVVFADVGGSIDLTQFVGATPVDDAEVIQPINGERADLVGVELAFVRYFSEFRAPWNNFLVSANATFTDSEAQLAMRADDIELPRQSDTVVNLALGYETERFSFRVAATYKSDALLALEELDDPAFDVYQDGHTQVDLSARFNLTDQWQVYFDGNNLTDEPFYAYFDRPIYNRRFERYGRSYALGVRYSLQ